MTPEEMRERLVEVNRSLDTWSLDLWAGVHMGPLNEALLADADCIEEAYSATIAGY